MLIQLSIRNYKTFKERTVLSLVASNYDKETREDENIIIEPTFNLRLVKSAVIYGANASGKSKFIEALLFMKHFIETSSKDTQKGDFIDVEPFKLHTDSENDTSEFEVVFLHNKEMFRYGFAVNSTIVAAEWLYHKPKTKEIELLYREGQDFTFHRSFTKGNILKKEKLVRDNALALSTAAQFNDTISSNVLDWFKNLRILSGLQSYEYSSYTALKISNSLERVKILDLLEAADTGIDDLSLKPIDTSNLPKDMPRELVEKIKKDVTEKNAQYFSDVLTIHKKYNSDNKYIEDVKFSMSEDESDGTEKYFNLTGPIVDVLENGRILVVDELDSQLHPNLVCKIISLFNSKKFNPYNAQIIFNTHDTNLLESELFRRDQIWFIEKDRYGAATLYSLSDFKSDVRKDDNFKVNYLRGKYGAIPLLHGFNSLSYLEKSSNENTK